MRAVSYAQPPNALREERLYAQIVYQSEPWAVIGQSADSGYVEWMVGRLAALHVRFTSSTTKVAGMVRGMLCPSSFALSRCWHGGHDVTFAGDVDCRMPDTDMLPLAHSEQRIIFTMDTDFGELVYHSRQPHTGVLLLRMPGVSRDEKIRIVHEIVSRYGD